MGEPGKNPEAKKTGEEMLGLGETNSKR